MAKWRLIQVTDTHLYAEKTNQLLGLKTYNSLQQVIELIQAKEQHIDAVIHTGDMSQDLSQQSYEHLAKLLQQLKVPIYWTTGNHDERNTASNFFVGKFIKEASCFELGNWQIKLLDSQIPGEVHGELSTEVMKQITSISQLTLLALHHPPLPFGTKWLDTLGLQNGKQLLELITNNENIKILSCGHAHQDFSTQIAHCQYFCTPSTCIQFDGTQDDFALARLAPGYRWFELDDDGSVATGVNRVDNFDFQDIEFTSTGYK